MRVCVTSATSGNREICFKILDFMRSAKTGFKALPNAFLYSNKIDVLEQSLQKVEQGTTIYLFNISNIIDNLSFSLF